MKYIENEGIEYIIGENANDNWDVLKSSKQSWIWFHLDKLSSPYVILSSPFLVPLTVDRLIMPYLYPIIFNPSVSSSSFYWL